MRVWKGPHHPKVKIRRETRKLLRSAFRIKWHILIANWQTLFLFCKVNYNMVIEINLRLEEGALPSLVLVRLAPLEGTGVNSCVNVILYKLHCTFKSSNPYTEQA